MPIEWREERKAFVRTYIGRCKLCKTAKRWTVDVERIQTFRSDMIGAVDTRRKYSLAGMAIRDPECLPCEPCIAENPARRGIAYIAGKQINGTTTDQPCGAKCLAAIGPQCDCACGGKNHGGKHAG